MMGPRWDFDVPESAAAESELGVGVPGPDVTVTVTSLSAGRDEVRPGVR
jgi:hypothetical protein